MTTATQVARPRRTVVRTAVQVFVALCALLPVAVGEIVTEFPDLAPYFGIPLAAAAVVTRLMASVQVEAFLTRFVPWLAADPDAAARDHLHRSVDGDHA